jgi:hypothetical protein
MTQISDTARGKSWTEHEAESMSEYFLADEKARERAGQRDREPDGKAPEPKQAQDMKVTLLGDFLISSGEPQGGDPYNATNGRSVREAWRTRRDRR